ncbi:hypothetical protein PV325_012449 [Microctonus aethiopoides]|nr:hypothetical protein PV325_012449 [Microctonus aethiopoides]
MSNYDDINAGSTRDDIMDHTQRSVAEIRSQIERLNDFLSRPRRRTTSESSRSSSHSPPRREYLASRTEQPIINNLTSENNPSTSRANQHRPDYPQHRLDILSPRVTHQLSTKDYLQAIPHFDGTPMGYEADEFIVQYDINKLQQTPHEKMNIYIARVQELLTDLKELLRNSDVPDKDAAARVLKHDIIKAFVRGLQPKYLIHFTTKSFTDLASAFAEGRRVEQELSEFPQLYSKGRDCYAIQTNEVTEYKPEPSTE